MTASTVSKNQNIKKTMKETMTRRTSQSCAVYKVKIDESNLSKKQKEQLKMIFVEAKWFYNNILSWSENHDINDFDTKIKKVNILNKDKEIETKELKNPYITIGTVYVLQCINCGKIKEKAVYTDSNYLI